MGPIDVLVANAGVGRQAIRQQVDDELWDQTFAVNVTASWQLTRAAAPGMVELGAPPCAEHWGRIRPDPVRVLHRRDHRWRDRAALRGQQGGAARADAPHVHPDLRPPASRSTSSRPHSSPAPASCLRAPPNGRRFRFRWGAWAGRSVAATALAMLTNPYLTNKLITLDGGIHPS
jgi:3-oxoacyl-[acyl-carrier protein] reductase